MSLHAPDGWKEKNGISEKTGEVDLHEADHDTLLSPSKKACASSWARLIAKIYEVDPLMCPGAGLK